MRMISFNSIPLVVAFHVTSINSFILKQNPASFLNRIEKVKNLFTERDQFLTKQKGQFNNKIQQVLGVSEADATGSYGGFDETLQINFGGSNVDIKRGHLGIQI
jgi:hypothetical protein